MHTPGHAPGHLSYVLSESDGEPAAVFTSGSMLFGAVGRTDLIGPDQTEPLTRAQYRSIRRLAELPDAVAVYPTHGFGSFCSATPTSGDSSTIGAERTANVALASDEDTFVKELIAGLGALAAGRIASYRVSNFAGLAKARERGGGATVLDVRSPDEWQSGHISGASHIPLWELGQRISEVPGGEVWVHCASGFRASIAASHPRPGRPAGHPHRRRLVPRHRTRATHHQLNGSEMTPADALPAASR
jgi:Rhodanese-like domain